MSMMRKQRRGQMRRSLRSGIGILAAGALMMGGMNHAMALPQGGQVAAGAADIAASQAEMAIHQATQNAVINWNSFNIGAGERVNIYQPNAQAALLNRVLGGNPSEIFGTLGEWPRLPRQPCGCTLCARRTGGCGLDSRLDDEHYECGLYGGQIRLCRHADGWESHQPRLSHCEK